jgi:hypothetical protein
MGFEFDRRDYIEITSFAIAAQPEGGRVVLLKSIDSRTITVPLGYRDSESEPDDGAALGYGTMPSPQINEVPERVLRVTLEEVTPWGIIAEIHVEDGVGFRRVPCGTSQAFGFALTRKCPVFIRRSLLDCEEVVVEGVPNLDLGTPKGVSWIRPEREPVSIEVGHNESPIVRIAGVILQQAIDDRASEVTIEPSDVGIQVKYLVQGAWREAMTLPSYLQAPLMARLKSTAGMSSAVRMEPQEGFIPARYRDGRYDIAVSVRPAPLGETLSMKIAPVR